MSRAVSLEKIAVVHAAATLVFTSWAFGGNLESVRVPLAVFGSLSVFVTIAAVRDRLRESIRGNLRALHLLWPLLGYNALVLIGALQPAFTAGVIDGAPVLVPVAQLTAWPCSAIPADSLRQLWMFNALFLPAFNLLLAVRERRLLRALLVAVAANAAFLAIFGTIQKLGGARGLFFDAVRSPNPTFFASFIYHNHWGAFTVLLLAAVLGLAFHANSRGRYRDFWHSPAFPAAITALVLAAAVPLSTSRSCTALVGLLLATAFCHGLFKLIKTRRDAGRLPVLPLALLVIGAAAAIYAVYDLARPMILARAADTHVQLAAIRAQGGIGSRAQLYADTWRMAQDRPAFGWGLGSYPAVFQRYNTQQSTDGLPLFYVDAHSDWLQLLAETGYVGTTLLGLLVALPFVRALRRRPGRLPAYLLAGCGLVLLYAWIEFPFGCPAVLAAFWLCLFAATRLAELEGNEKTVRAA